MGPKISSGRSCGVLDGRRKKGAAEKIEKRSKRSRETRAEI